MANETAADTRLTELSANIDDMFLIVNGILISFICAIFYWLIGYSLTFGPGNSVVGYSQWAGIDLASTSLAHWFFHFVFAATAATIISGAVAERCNFVAYLVYSSLVSGFVYPVVAHWVWADGGFLGTMGYHDFAGSGVVHLTAGVCSFVAAAFIGPRLGRFQDGVTVDKPGHSTPLFGVGGLLLMTGFLAFNGGSQGHISQSGDGAMVAKAVINTILGGSGAGVIALALGRSGLLGTATWPFGNSLNAILAGIVTMCAGANVLSFLGAVIAGACGCFVYLLLRSLVLRLKVDDPLDAVAVHLGGGLWGVVAVPIFAEGGLVDGSESHNLKGIWHNLTGAVVITAWSALCSVLIFGVLRVSGYLRVSEEEEVEGLDVSKHNEPAYPVGGWHVDPPAQQRTHHTFYKNASYTPDQGKDIGLDNLALELERQR